MFIAKHHRAKAAEYTELLKTASLPADIRELRKLEQSHLTLADNEEWIAANLEKTKSPGADDNWYGDLFPHGEVNAAGGLGAPAPGPSTQMPTQMQQLFDDAGSKGGMLQTATLRGQVARMMQTRKDDDAG
jgi:hypothetical protein